MVASHRLLRYATPFLHLVALARQRGAARRGLGLRRHLRAPARAARRRAAPGASSACAPLLVARYYVLTTASMAAGLWDYLRHGTPAGWSPPEGTR